MQDTIPAGTDLGPAIGDTVGQLLDAVLSLADSGTGIPSGSMFITMRDKAEDLAPLAAKLLELLEIQTQGGGGPAADGFTPAEPAAVAQHLHATTTATLAGRQSAQRDPLLRLLGEAFTP